MIFGVSGKASICIGLALLGCLFVACSTTTRYRVLDFLFDGVPPPPGMEVKRPTLDMETTTGFRDAMRQLREAAPERAPARVVRSVHKPYLERQCNQCHDMSRGGEDPARDASLCDRCHIDDRKRGGWDHGPINLGTCVPCHTPHNSEHEKLLTLPIPDLCLTCHTHMQPDATGAHDVPNFNDCVACHDPHRMY